MLRRLVFVLVGAVVVGVAAWRFAAATETRLFALDAASGRVAWSEVLASDGRLLSQPQVRNGRVVVWVEASGEDRGRFEVGGGKAFDVASGRRLWEFVPDKRFRGPCALIVDAVPSAAPDQIFVFYAEAKWPDDANLTLIALDAASGKPQWTFNPTYIPPRGLLNYSGLAVTDGYLAVLHSSSPSRSRAILVGLNARSGERQWSVDLDAVTATSAVSYLLDGPFGSDDAVILGNSSTIYAFDPRTGASTFTLDEGGSWLWLHETTLYRHDRRAGLATFDATSGAHRWTYIPEACRVFHLTERDLWIGPEAVYVASTCDRTATGRASGLLIALDPQHGTERWRTRVADDRWNASTSAVSAQGVFTRVRDRSPGTGKDRYWVLALASVDGSERWRFPLGVPASRIAADDRHVFVIDTSPRWRNWLAGLNPAWH